MKYRIHYRLPDPADWDDSFVVDGESLEAIKAQADQFFSSRGLSQETLECWSEEIK